MIAPEVDVVIPVHTPNRPIARAVGSILLDTKASVRVTVVCHNVESAPIALALGAFADHPVVRLLTHLDDIPSPAGPINAGLDAATGTFTALLDSDDTYDPGAIDAWLAVQRRDDADAVIPMLRYAEGGSTRTPPTRPFRVRGLNGVRDRLAYRSRQHGLVSRARFGDIRMATGLRTGEDVIQSLSIWYSGARISFARNDPGYRIHTDGGERTSASPKPARESLAFLDSVLEPSWLRTLDDAQQASLAIKLLRTHVMDVLASALNNDCLDDLPDIANAVRRIDAIAPRARRVLSRRDYRILSELSSASPSAVTLRLAVAVRADYRRPSNVFPAAPLAVLRREAPLRLLAGVAFSP